MGAMPESSRSPPVERLYNRASILAIEERFIAGNRHIAFDLMKRAGQAVRRAMLEAYPDVRHVQVLCGSGNNAGDGYVLAALLHSHSRMTGMRVEVLRVGRLPRHGETACSAFEMAQDSGVPILDMENTQIGELDADLVVDALLGTGVTGQLRPRFATAIRAINATSAPVLCIDMPSGMNPDTGTALDMMVEADLTVTFIGVKRGMATGSGKTATGTLILDRLGLSDSDFAGHSGHTQFHWNQMKSRLPTVSADAHKNRLGHLLIIGGDLGMGGAAIMAAKSALRVGTGLVTLVTRPEHVAAALTNCPEAMVLGIASNTDKLAKLSQSRSFDALVIGPGLGREDWGKALFREAAKLDLPTLVDGDGLSLLASNTPQFGKLSIITPHPGEAARLLDAPARAVNSDRFGAAVRLSRRYDAVALLKGAGSLVAEASCEDDEVCVCAEGNPGMATAGTGDVLSGIIGGFLAQGLSPLDATLCGTALHASAGDRAKSLLGPRSLNATDLIGQLPERLRDLD